MTPVSGPNFSAPLDFLGASRHPAPDSALSPAPDARPSALVTAPWSWPVPCLAMRALSLPTPWQPGCVAAPWEPWRLSMLLDGIPCPLQGLEPLCGAGGVPRGSRWLSPAGRGGLDLPQGEPWPGKQEMERKRQICPRPIRLPWTGPRHASLYRTSWEVWGRKGTWHGVCAGSAPCPASLLRGSWARCPVQPHLGLPSAHPGKAVPGRPGWVHRKCLLMPGMECKLLIFVCGELCLSSF